MSSAALYASAAMACPHIEVGQGVCFGEVRAGATERSTELTSVVDTLRADARASVGSSPAADGSHSLYAAVIVKRVDEKTRAKTGLNDLLRNLDD